MTRPPRTLQDHERPIAALLWYGSWIAVATLCASFITPLFGYDGLSLARAGIALFILLPVARVALLIFLFARARDPLYTMISIAVLAIIAAGFAVGLKYS